MNDLLPRVEKLESQLRRWRVATVLMLILLAVVLSTGAAYSQRDGLLQVPASRVAARSFVLVGDDGSTVYAHLTARDGKPVLNFYDESGKVVWSAPPRPSTKPLDTN